MAVLKIYNDIQSESEKMVARFWGDAEGVCFKDIDEFCDSIPPDDNQIDLRLHCDGGSVLEGWAIYDRIRATGKEVTATVEGNAASMATVVMMAAPKERRKAYESAQICVHNPWISPWGLKETLNASELQRIADDLKIQQNKIASLYAERCGCDKEEIQALMDEDRYIDTSEALRFGLISSIIPPMSAKKSINNSKINKKMAKEENVSVKRGLLDRILAKAGFKSIKEASAYGMELNTADGNVLTVQREEGAPAVGDTASPDGEWAMPDGSTIIVENGVITEIKPADGGDGGDGGDGKKGDKGDGSGDTAESELQATVAELEERIGKLEEQLTEAKAKARTTEDMKVLNAVKMAGGIEKVMEKFSSSYKPAVNQHDTGKVTGKERQERNYLREKIDNAKNKKRNK